MLSAITAAVVGVIANLALWFALHVTFRRVSEWAGPFGTRLQVPDWGTVDPILVLISAAAFLALFRYRVHLLSVLGASVIAGVLARGWAF